MLKIRLSRFGKKSDPHYRIVVTDKRTAAQGPYLEALGNYNPKKKELSFDKESILNWLKKGAQPSNTLAKLLKKEGLKHPLIVVKKFRAKTKEEIGQEKSEAEKERLEREKKLEEAKEAWEKELEEKAEEKAKEKEEAESIVEEKVTETESKVEETPGQESSPEEK